MKIELSRDQYRKLLILAHLGEHIINAPGNARDEEALALLSHLNSFGKDFESTDLVDPAPFQEDGRFYGTRELDELAFQHIEEYDDDIFWNDLAGHLAVRDLEDQSLNTDEEREEFIQARVEKYISEFEENGLDNFKLNVKG